MPLQKAVSVDDDLTVFLDAAADNNSIPEESESSSSASAYSPGSAVFCLLSLPRSPSVLSFRTFPWLCLVEMNGSTVHSG
jgi:hypothetical protein